MSDTKQTAVEWLFAQYKQFGVLGIKDFNKALEMEREQIIQARVTAPHCFVENSNEAEQYYTICYGNK